MSDLVTSTNVTINIDLNAAIKAGAHQRIAHLENEIVRLDAIASAAKDAAEKLVYGMREFRVEEPA